METVAVAVLIVLAAGYLWRRAASVFKSTETNCGCSRCNGCNTGGDPASENQLDCTSPSRR